MAAATYMAHMDNLFNELLDLDNQESIIHEWMDIIDANHSDDWQTEATAEKFAEWLFKNK